MRDLTSNELSVISGGWGLNKDDQPPNDHPLPEDTGDGLGDRLTTVEDYIAQDERNSAQEDRFDKYVEDCRTALSVWGAAAGLAVGVLSTGGPGALGGAVTGASAGDQLGKYMCENDGNAREMKNDK